MADHEWKNQQYNFDNLGQVCIKIVNVCGGSAGSEIMR
jgi:hypothetical protein